MSVLNDAYELIHGSFTIPYALYTDAVGIDGQDTLSSIYFVIVMHACLICYITGIGHTVYPLLWFVSVW